MSLIPIACLKDVLTRLPTHKASQIADLLPIAGSRLRQNPCRRDDAGIKVCFPDAYEGIQC